MYKVASAICVSGVLLAGAMAARAEISWQPRPPDIRDLDGHYYYVWGMKLAVPEGQTIVEASLFFDNIRSLGTMPNALYVHLLPDAPLGLRQYTDSPGDRNAFVGQGIQLVTYSNLPGTPQALTYNFTGAQLNALASYGADGNFAIGLDPDSHFSNDGVSLRPRRRA